MRYAETIEGITPAQLQGFFVGWPNPPSPETHLAILRRAFKIILAIDDTSGRVVGFINAVSDGVYSVYLPLLEVLPAYRGKGIGKELVRRMLDGLREFYMVDLLCDPELQTFYERFGMFSRVGMAWRNFDRQSGARP
ncbi:GNAT family N-acetyltransferase [candidate division GN15 bacterium]|uniref:GNAT family N-acetyltransferase n=1 Tax=candidate division GN15 bacterium TaxID=2072418 RepID=A0A855X6T1_9BACT|nr:MAG: GNAT family N-acetyltransferase [candidate division GN15 bacterium]